MGREYRRAVEHVNSTMPPVSVYREGQKYGCRRMLVEECARTPAKLAKMQQMQRPSVLHGYVHTQGEAATHDVR